MTNEKPRELSVLWDEFINSLVEGHILRENAHKMQQCGLRTVEALELQQRAFRNESVAHHTFTEELKRRCHPSTTVRLTEDGDYKLSNG